MLMTKIKSKFVPHKRHIQIQRINEQYVDNNILKIGYRAPSQPYDSKEIIASREMKDDQIKEWLDQIEMKNRGFYHNHNTYYGCEHC